MTHSEKFGLKEMRDGRCYWRAPVRFVKAGYQIRNVRLEGRAGDGQDEARLDRCRLLLAEAERWLESLNRPKVPEGTWAYLFARYRGDAVSPIHDVKANTRESYLREIAYWEAVIGSWRVADTDYTRLRELVKAMKAKGRSQSFVHRKIEHLRTFTSYGVALRMPGARDAREALSLMRVPAAPARTSAPTREQVYQIIEAADAAGLGPWADGVMFQFEFGLRAVDVRGQWLIADGDGLRKGARIWADGLTWEMFDRDLTRFDKVISKTRKSMPEPLRFDLTAVPVLRERLLARAPDVRRGPVILCRHGRPYDKRGWSAVWARLRKQCGLPEHLWLMDVRAGAATEAKRLGVDPLDARDFMQHQDVGMTSRYLRDRSDGLNKVVQLRQERK